MISLVNSSFLLEAKLRASRLLAATIKRLDAEMGYEGTCSIFAHSMGGHATYSSSRHLSYEERMRVDVFSFGSAKLIQEGVFRGAKNYVSIGDPIPIIADPIGYACGFFGIGNISMERLTCQGIPGLDHCWDGKTYLGARKWLTQNMQN